MIEVDCTLLGNDYGEGDYYCSLRDYDNDNTELNSLEIVGEYFTTKKEAVEQIIELAKKCNLKIVEFGDFSSTEDYFDFSNYNN